MIFLAENIALTAKYCTIEYRIPSVCKMLYYLKGIIMYDNYLKNINMKYVDAIMIVDHNGRIVYSVRFNPRFNDETNLREFRNIKNKNFLEVYPTLDVEESSIINCLKYGIIKYNENQNFMIMEESIIQNLTLPIIRAAKCLVL